MLTLSTNKDNYEELKKNPLLFLTKEVTYYENSSGYLEQNILWKPSNKDYEGIIHLDKKVNKFNHLLMVAGNEVKKEKVGKNSNLESVTFEIYVAEPTNPNHWIIIFNSYINRSRNKEDKYPYIYLLWFINHHEWNINTFRNVLQCYNITIQPFLFNILSKIGRCLSYTKQESLVKVLGHFNFEYKIYYPTIIPNALNKISPKIEKHIDKNLFGLVDYILGCDEDNANFRGSKRTRESDPSNPLLSLYHWFNDQNNDFDYKTLKPLFSIVSLRKQFHIVKRYFHDIRLKKTQLDNTLLQEFKDNTFSDFIRYRYCIYSPDTPINLCVSLLCDCLSTIKITNGESFQSFDGILDFAINNCDVTKPNINLGLEYFISRCQGGAVYNSYFAGFIDYALICEFDETKFYEDNLLAIIYNLLDKKAKHITYDVCSFDGTPLSSEELKQCKKRLNNGVQLSCSKTMHYKDKWNIDTKEVGWINLFLTEAIEATKTPTEKTITISQISTEVFVENIKKIADSYKIKNSNTYLLKSEDLDKFEINLLYQLSRPVNIRIFPRTTSLMGTEFNVFGLSDIPSSKEMEMVYKRVVDSLTKELSTNYNGHYFEIPYNENKLHNILKLYYYKRTASNNITDLNRTFLCKYKGNNKQFCAPKLAETHNRATDLPFYWCRGKECFKNGLEKQVLENCSDWKDYSLYHLIEIIGYPKLHKVEGGYEPDEIITKFIAIANKVVKKFNRLKCRNCGHLMRVVKNGSFNRYNYYSCYNPTCEEYQKSIYLNFCFKCKRGLIDSRDHVQCPNGWYICPDCHSCCDDSQYDRLSQKYIISNKPIPQKIKSNLKNGHNDKGIYFCHKCGEQLDIIVEGDKLFIYCEQCNVKTEFKQ